MAKQRAFNEPELSVVLPVYNEADTVAEILERVSRASFEKEVVVVNDGSNDLTSVSIRRWMATAPVGASVRFLEHCVNRGKGAAICTALAEVRAEITLVQDADLEYDPRDYSALVEPILSGRCDVVFGSRFMRPAARRGPALNRLCVALLNFAVWLLFHRRITDEATGYKAFRTDLLRRLDLQCERFECCPEVTAKLCRLGIAIHEVPISYTPRSAAEGKKIGWRDAVQAFWTLIWWRFAPVRLLDDDELARKADEWPSRVAHLPEEAQVAPAGAEVAV